MMTDWVMRMATFFRFLLLVLCTFCLGTYIWIQIYADPDYHLEIGGRIFDIPLPYVPIIFSSPTRTGEQGEKIHINDAVNLQFYYPNLTSEIEEDVLGIQCHGDSLCTQIYDITVVFSNSRAFKNSIKKYLKDAQSNLNKVWMFDNTYCVEQDTPNSFENEKKLCIVDEQLVAFFRPAPGDLGVVRAYGFYEDDLILKLSINNPHFQKAQEIFEGIKQKLQGYERKSQ
ncbi:hypothetical protein [Magnetococcus sp. PR-3]|uniref:hypothetical protein n=1 Tax=Magnetococcus sp. PR-3 TaxID=3120355 RepID=UPI002FCE3102